MDMLIFLRDIGVAVVIGVAIGVERQYRQHPAGLRTNALVAVGAALFVSLTRLTPGESSPTRIAAQVVSGIGFLGGGVILRDRFNVKGISTAATIWCSAALGSLSGAGFPTHASIGAITILSLHLALRPLGSWIDARQHKAIHVLTLYKLHAVCSSEQETLLRSIVMRHVNSLPRMVVQGIAIQKADRVDQTVVLADILSTERNDRELEDLISRLKIEPGVSAVRWEVVREEGN
jgi:putative Mg2+ transporter-C (MgtC) family protein